MFGVGAQAATIMSASVTVAGVATANLSKGGSSSTEELLLQFGGVGACLIVGLWFIRRSDKRDAENELRSQEELRNEREAHDDTRRRLLEAMSINRMKDS